MIHFVYRVLRIDSSFSRIDYEFTFSFHDFLLSFREFIMNFLSVTLILFFESINWELIHLFRELTINSLFFSRIDCEFTFIFAIYYGFIVISANSLWIHYQLQKVTIDPLCFPRILNQLREITMNSKSITRIHHG